MNSSQPVAPSVGLRCRSQSEPAHVQCMCVVWCGVVWCGVVWCGVVWCGVVWCGVVWCGVVWCTERKECQRHMWLDTVREWPSLDLSTLRHQTGADLEWMRQHNHHPTEGQTARENIKTQTYICCRQTDRQIGCACVSVCGCTCPSVHMWVQVSERACILI